MKAKAQRVHPLSKVNRRKQH